MAFGLDYVTWPSLGPLTNRETQVELISILGSLFLSESIWGSDGLIQFDSLGTFKLLFLDPENESVDETSYW